MYRLLYLIGIVCLLFSLGISGGCSGDDSGSSGDDSGDDDDDDNDDNDDNDNNDNNDNDDDDNNDDNIDTGSGDDDDDDDNDNDDNDDDDNDTGDDDDDNDDDTDTGGEEGCDISGALNYPFGSHLVPYVAGLTPSDSQEEMDSTVEYYYGVWKERYLREGTGFGCGAGTYLVATNHNTALTVSEAHGYGMLIAVLMAGHEADAQAIFDGMYRYYVDHPSQSNPYLMSWAQNAQCQNAGGSHSAADGDLDIAYSLLMADKQWGSGGEIDYASAATAILGAIDKLEVDVERTHVLMGDWVDFVQEEFVYYYATRSSDFMPGHFETFEKRAQDGSWTRVNDSTYAAFLSLQETHSAASGLVPDFIANPSTDPRPVSIPFHETETDDDYAYNACRVPWRLGSHYLTSGDERAKQILTKISEWLKATSGGDPDNISAGYTMEGSPLSGSGYTSMAFVAPFAVAAVAGNDQEWLDTLWGFVRDYDYDEAIYFDDTVGLLSMLAISGNWWAPEDVDCE